MYKKRTNDLKKETRMVQIYFLDSWLSRCSHLTANSTPKNGLRHFSALPTHHPKKWCNLTDKKNNVKINNLVVKKMKIHLKL